MKYPFAIIIATLFVFALMALVIITGQLRFTTPPPPTHLINIKSAVHYCPSVKKTPPDTEFTKKIATLCNHHATCAIDTQSLMGTIDAIPYCTETFHIKFTCSSETKVTHAAFLYEGQRDTIICNNEPIP